MAVGKTEPRAVVVLSGGLDSSTLLGKLIDDAWQIELALTFDYGQRHAREIRSAKDVAAHYGVSHRIIGLSDVAEILKGSSTLTAGGAVPEGHYAEETMRATVVPNRNAMFINIAASVAVAREAHVVAIAVHAGDHYIYPDCRPAFVKAQDSALREATENALGLYAPFVHKSKADLVKLGISLDVPFHLTWSCYQGAVAHCGRCGTCVERLEAFEASKWRDPVEYRDRDFWRQAVKQHEARIV